MEAPTLSKLERLIREEAALKELLATKLSDRTLQVVMELFALVHADLEEERRERTRDRRLAVAYGVHTRYSTHNGRNRVSIRSRACIESSDRVHPALTAPAQKGRAMCQKSP
jgi:hypothetical protein